MKLTEIYKALKDKPLYEISDINDQIDPTKTYGDLSDKEWEAEREKTGMKKDDEGNLYIDREYDPGNEPLEIQMSETGDIYYIEPEDIEAYVSGETVTAVDPDRGMDEIEANENNSNVTSQGEKEIEKLYGVGVDDVRQAYKDEADPMGFLSNLDLSEIGCTEQEIAEGTCGYGINGELGDKPAGSHLMKERFQKLANIIK